MSREVIYRCAGPDCNLWIQTADAPPPRGWINLREREGDKLTDLDFCGWQCLLFFASSSEPEQVIPADL